MTLNNSGLYSHSYNVRILLSHSSNENMANKKKPSRKREREKKKLTTKVYHWMDRLDAKSMND